MDRGELSFSRMKMHANPICLWFLTWVSSYENHCFGINAHTFLFQVGHPTIGQLLRVCPVFMHSSCASSQLVGCQWIARAASAKFKAFSFPVVKSYSVIPLFCIPRFTASPVFWEPTSSGSTCMLQGRLQSIVLPASSLGLQSHLRWSRTPAVVYMWPMLHETGRIRRFSRASPSQHLVYAPSPNVLPARGHQCCARN